MHLAAPPHALLASASYKAFDETTGCEVAWNKVKLRNVDERERKQLDEEVVTLGMVRGCLLRALAGRLEPGDGTGRCQRRPCGRRLTPPPLAAGPPQHHPLLRHLEG